MFPLIRTPELLLLRVDMNTTQQLKHFFLELSINCYLYYLYPAIYDGRSGAGYGNWQELTPLSNLESSLYIIYWEWKQPPD